MSAKPEALRLAEWLDGAYEGDAQDAAAELRRLHAECERLRADAGRWQYVAEHWFKAKQHWNNDAGNTPRALTLEIRCQSFAHGGAKYITDFIDAAIDAARKP